MEPTIKSVASLDAAELRELLPKWIKSHIYAPPELREKMVSSLRKALDTEDNNRLEGMLKSYGTAGDNYEFYPADPSARKIGRAFLKEIIKEQKTSGFDRLAEVITKGPCLLLSNHISYADSQITDLLLSGYDGCDAADRLLFVAGPKVYDDPFRRIATISLNTLKTAQSARKGLDITGLAHLEAARIALDTVNRAGELMREGLLVVLYAEGTRSKTGKLGSFLKAASRYASSEETTIVPLALSGSNRIFPVHQKLMHPAGAAIEVGEPIPVHSCNSSADAFEKAWICLAGMLPAEYKPFPGTPPLV